MPGTKSTPWNKGKSVGQRLALAQTFLLRLVELLRAAKKVHDLVLLMVGVDTMLRVSDLLNLRVCDLLSPDGGVRETFSWRQQKTNRAVEPLLSEQTRQALLEWITLSGKSSSDYIFTRTKNSHGKPISADAYRKIVKQWAEMLGLEPTLYSTHSIRRTKPTFMYQRGVSIEDIALLLGHRSKESTMRYLGLTIAQAHNQARTHDIFDTRKQGGQRDNPASASDPNLSDKQLKTLARYIAEEQLRLSSLPPNSFDQKA